MPWTNFHSHTHYCDGTDAPEVYVKAALEQQMPIYGFSTHAPVPFENGWSIKDDRVPDYIEEVLALKEKYEGQIELYLSMEVDHVPGLTGVNDYFIKNLGLDYTIGSVHFIETFEDGKPWEIDGPHKLFADGLEQIFDNKIQHAVASYFDITRDMINDHTPDIVGHMDKIKMHNDVHPYFSETDNWYRDEVMATLDAIADKGIIMEVNTRGIYKKYTKDTYPGDWVVQEAFLKGIPVMINSDCHHPRELTLEFEATAAMLLKAGYKTVRILKGGEWTDVPFTEKGLQL